MKLVQADSHVITLLYRGVAARIGIAVPGTSKTLLSFRARASLLWLIFPVRYLIATFVLRRPRHLHPTSICRHQRLYRTRFLDLDFNFFNFPILRTQCFLALTLYVFFRSLFREVVLLVAKTLVTELFRGEGFLSLEFRRML